MNFMKYIESNLLENEKLVYEIGPHWIVFTSGCAMIALGIVLWLFLPLVTSVAKMNIIAGFTIHNIAFLVCFCVGMYWLVSAYIYYMTSEYGITNKRVLIKTGWIERESLELMLDKVEGVLVDQTIMGRVFNFGMITVIGTGGTRDSFPFIPDPLQFRKEVQQQIEIFEGKI